MEVLEDSMIPSLPTIPPQLQDNVPKPNPFVTFEINGLADPFRYGDLGDYEDIEFWESFSFPHFKTIQEIESNVNNGNYKSQVNDKSISDLFDHPPHLMQTNAGESLVIRTSSMGSFTLLPRRLTWEKVGISAPGGNLQDLIRYRPLQLSELVQGVNESRITAIRNKLRSCLTEIYLGYLNTAVEERVITATQRDQYKKDWLASSDWRKLGVTGSRQDVLPIVGSSHNYGRLNDCSNQDAGHGYSHSSEWDAPAFSGTYPDVSPISSALPTAVNASRAQSLLMKLRVASEIQGVAGIKREPEAFDIQDDYNKRQKMSFGSIGDGRAMHSGYATPDLIQLPTPDSCMSRDSSHNGISLQGGNQYVATAPNLSLLLEAHQASKIVPHSPSIPVSINTPYSSLEHLPEEEAATLWLDYNLRSVLDTHPPKAPKDPAAKHAVERARPYLLSIKTKLSVLQVMHGHDERFVSELGSALKDVDTAWDCLRVVQADKDMVPNETAAPMIKVEQIDAAVT